MAENSLIAWTHNTFNPWIGCVKVSDGCKNCYAETLVVNRMGKKHLWGPAKTHARARTSPANWQHPVRWNREAEKKGAAMRVFCASLCDVFEEHQDAESARPDLFRLIRATPFLQWQLLTKRPENIAAMLPDDWGNHGYPNVWLGTSIESMKVAERVAILGEIPAAVRFISYEPALGPLDDLDISRLDWIIFGGESGPGFRPMDLAWPRAMNAKIVLEKLRRVASDTGLAEPGPEFFFKQSAAPRTEMGITLDGETIRNYPVPRSVTQPEHYGLTRGMAQLEAARKRIIYDRRDEPHAPFFGGARPEAAHRAGLPLFNSEG